MCGRYQLTTEENIGFTSVAGTGNQTIFGGGDGIERQHAQPRCDVHERSLVQICYTVKAGENHFPYR